MKVKIEDIAADISRNEELVEFLDTVLTECSDRAYVVCSAK